MLTSTRFSNQFLLTHIFGQQGLSHTMVKLVGSRMVQIFTLQVNASSVLFRQSVAIIHRRWTPLIMLTNTAQLGNEIVRFTDGKISIVDALQIGRASCRERG